MKIKFKLIIFCLAVLLASIIVHLHYMFTHGELGGKAIYANLQAISESQTSNPNAASQQSPLFIKDAFHYLFLKYDVLGIPTGESSSPYFLIVTNTHTDNNPATPNGIYYLTHSRSDKISCNYLDNLNKKEDIDPIVNQFLKNKCTSP
ncbi:hypothetical protein ACIPDS_13800 [Kluyvera sp. NPDC087067]|uniref:hypothetical protein n=1 Tax=Kluyvera sp. NPDC087067 TaxID=3364105 RepID=UPI00380A4D0A